MLLVLTFFACGGAEAPTASTPAATPTPPPPPPEVHGGFFVWYNPGKMVYQSADGSAWKPVAPLPSELDNWYNSFAADAAGRLYVIDMHRELWTSGDDAKTWTKVVRAGTRPAGMDDASMFICGGAANQLAAVSSAGRTFASTDAGQSWVETGRLAPEGASGSGGGFQGGCAFSADGKRLLAEGWYFDPAGAQLGVSADGGATWTVQPRPDSNIATNGVGFVTGGIAYAHGGGYSQGAVSFLPDGGQAWTKSGEIRGAAGTEYAQQIAATDGANTVVVWQNPAKGASGGAPVPALAFVSHDAGHTFSEVKGPVAADPTPESSDEYLGMVWSNGKAPGPLPSPAAK